MITSRIPGRRSILSGFDADDWRLASPILGDQLRALADEGFHVVVASNQESIRGALYGPRAAPKVKARVDAFMAVLIAQGVSATVMLATAADDDLGRDEWNCRKPDTGLWDLLAERYNGGVPVDRRASFLVGGDGDVADPNREFAAAIGVADFGRLRRSLPALSLRRPRPFRPPRPRLTTTPRLSPFFTTLPRTTRASQTLRARARSTRRSFFFSAPTAPTTPTSSPRAWFPAWERESSGDWSSLPRRARARSCRRRPAPRRPRPRWPPSPRRPRRTGRSIAWASEERVLSRMVHAFRCGRSGGRHGCGGRPRRPRRRASCCCKTVSWCEPISRLISCSASTPSRAQRGGEQLLARRRGRGVGGTASAASTPTPALPAGRRTRSHAAFEGHTPRIKAGEGRSFWALAN